MARPPKHDQAIVGLIARTKMARTTHVARCLEMSMRNAYARLRKLTRDGLLDVNAGVPGGWIYFLTPLGTETCGFDLPTPRFSLVTIEHDLACTDALVALEAAGVACLSERELRAYERECEDGRHIFDYRHPDTGRLAEHSPDLVIERPGGDEFIAVEVELTQKSAERRRVILRGYRDRVDRDGFIGVLYLTGPRCKAGRFGALADEVGLDDAFVAVPLSEVAPIPQLRQLVAASRRRAVRK